MPQSSALLLPPPHLQPTDIFSSLPLHQSAIHPTSLAANSGMLQTPYASSQSLSSSEDSPSPRTPAISDSASSSSPRTTPSPNIQSLSLSAAANEQHASDINNDERYPLEQKQASTAPIRHPEVVLTMQQPGQHNLPQEQPPSNTGKGGCWTCRIRRKKCDEQRTGDSCRTCIRLRIDCLGWGPKRPAWMRDKQAVEAYKAGIKDKLIKAGMVRGQPRLPRESASQSSTLPSGPSIPSGPPAHSQYNHQQPASRSMSGPAAFGGLGGMGPIGPMGAFGVMGGSMPGGGTGFDFGQQQYTQQHHPPPQHSVRYGPYPSSRTLQGFSSPHLAAQRASQIPQESAVMGSDFDYLGFPEHGENNPQPQHPSRRASMDLMPSHYQTTQHLDNRRRSLAYSSSSSVAGGSSSHGNSPYIAGHNPLGGPYANSVSNQGTQLVDFSGDVFGNMGSSGGVANASPAISGLTVPGMSTISGVPVVSGSPSMVPADESMLFHSGMYVPSRPSSSSASATTPSRSNSSPNAGYSDPLADRSLLDPHIQYYFNSVMPMQYAFSSEGARGVLQNLFAREPFGPLVNASCALAAKHNKMLRVARLLDPPDVDPQQSTAQQFFDRAYWQLADTTAREAYTASGALASLHLVAYFLLQGQGGSGAWQVHLDMARTWLTQTDLCAPENEAPKDTLALMGDAEQLAAKMTIWYDVFAAISQHQSPRFLATYRRLFGNTIEYDGANQSSRVTDMSHLMGCSEDVLLILAETALKAQEHQLGTLSDHELLRRGVAIEERLLVSTVAEETQFIQSTVYGAAPGTSSQMHPTDPSGHTGTTQRPDSHEKGGH